MRKKRIYKKGVPGSEYDAYHGKPEQIARRANRNEKRDEAEEKGLVKKGDSKEVHHVDAPRTGSLEGVRTRVVSRKYNRARQPKRS